MRDQRMMNNLGKISRKMRVSLRNSLTRRHPAVPLPRSVDREWDENDKGYQKEVLDLGNDVEFLGLRVGSGGDSDRSGISKHMQQWQEDLDERLKGRDIPPRYWEHPELEKGGIHKHCAYCYEAGCEKTFDLSDDRGCHVVDCRHKCGRALHLCKLFEHQMICPNYEETDDYAWMYRGMDSATNRERIVKAKQRKEREKQALKPAESLFVGPGFPAASMKAKKTRVKNYFVPAPPPMPESVLRTCRLDLKLETVTRLQTKPKAMYTFVCAQEFRRDEYHSHSKNVHDDIHGGMNNWMEHRCPLAAHGCQFASRRLYPHDNTHTVRFSSAVESFGVTKRDRGAVLPPYQTFRDGQTKILFDLPTEILMGILLKLDSFS